MLKDKGSGDVTARTRGDTYGFRPAPEFAAVIGFLPGLVLPLVNHLMEQRVYRLIPAVSADVSPADDYLGTPAPLATPDIMTEPALHAPRHADLNRGKLPAETCRVEMRVVLHQLPDERHICWVCALSRPVAALRPGDRGLGRRVEVQHELELCLRAAYQSAERSKQRWGPGEKVFVVFDQM